VVAQLPLQVRADAWQRALRRASPPAGATAADRGAATDLHGGAHGVLAASDGAQSANLFRVHWEHRAVVGAGHNIPQQQRRAFADECTRWGTEAPSVPQTNWIPPTCRHGRCLATTRRVRRTGLLLEPTSNTNVEKKFTGTSFPHTTSSCGPYGSHPKRYAPREGRRDRPRRSGRVQRRTRTGAIPIAGSIKSGDRTCRPPRTSRPCEGSWTR
jgi:hypothetical protein